MQVRFDLKKNVTVWLDDGNLTMICFKDFHITHNKIVIADIIEDVKAAVKLFLDVNELPKIEEKNCDDLTIRQYGFESWMIEVSNDNDEKRYFIKGKGE